MPLTSIFSLRLRLRGLTRVPWQRVLFLHPCHWNDSNGWQWIGGVCWVAGGVMRGRECDERERVNTGIQYYWVFVSWENNVLLKTHSIFKCHSLRSILYASESEGKRMSRGGRDHFSIPVTEMIQTDDNESEGCVNWQGVWWEGGSVMRGRG